MKILLHHVLFWWFNFIILLLFLYCCRCLTYPCWIWGIMSKFPTSYDYDVDLFKVSGKRSILVFIFSRTLSLEASFLEIFSLILACSKIKSLKDGCLKLEEL
jgi:hypothetical protein